MNSVKKDNRCALHRSGRQAAVSEAPRLPKEHEDLLIHLLGPLPKRLPPRFKGSCWHYLHDGSFCVERLTRRRQWRGKKSRDVKLRLSLPVGETEILVIECNSASSDAQAWEYLAQRLIHMTSGLLAELSKRPLQKVTPT